jgi:hypothetical protein
MQPQLVSRASKVEGTSQMEKRESTSVRGLASPQAERMDSKSK